MIIAINLSNRVIDKMLPQQHREVTEKEAAAYKRLLPTEIKIVEIQPTTQELVGEITHQEVQPVKIPQIIEEEQVVHPIEEADSQASFNVEVTSESEALYGYTN